jgi:hypothetical protein
MHDEMEAGRPRVGLLAVGMRAAGMRAARGSSETGEAQHLEARHIDAVTDFGRGGGADLLLEERARGDGQTPDRTWLVRVDLWSGQVHAVQPLDGQRLLSPVSDKVALRAPTGLVTRSVTTLALHRDEAAWRSRVPELAALTPDSTDCYEPATAEFRFSASDGRPLTLSLLDDSVKAATSTTCEQVESTTRELDVGASRALSVASMPGSAEEQVVGVGAVAITGYDLRYLNHPGARYMHTAFLFRSTSPGTDAWTEVVRLDVDASNQLTRAPTWTTKLFQGRRAIKRAELQIDKDYGGCKNCEGFKVRQTLVLGDASESSCSTPSPARCSGSVAP